MTLCKDGTKQRDEVSGCERRATGNEEVYQDDI